MKRFRTPQLYKKNLIVSKILINTNSPIANLCSTQKKIAKKSRK